MTRHTLTRLTVLALLLSLAPAAALAAAPAAEPSAPAVPTGRNQMLANPGFESGTSAWILPASAPAGAISVATDHPHSGSSCLKLTASSPDQSLVLTSDFFPVSPDAELDADLFLRTPDLQPAPAPAGDSQPRGRRSRGGISVSLEVFGPDKTTQLMTMSLASASSPLADWTRFQAQTLLSKYCSFARYRISLSSATGTVFLDDAAAWYLPIPAVDPSAVPSPALLPVPWIVQRSSDSFPLAKTALLLPESDVRLHNAFESALSSLHVPYSFVSSPNDPAATSAPILLRFSTPADPEISSLLEARFPGHSLAELGNEGYFLSVRKAGDRAVVSAAANTEAGRFYALQTLRQLMAGGKLHAADILDRPTMKRRGIVMSAKRFNAPDTLERMAASKMNTSWSQGGFVADKFKQKWRDPFTPDELALLKAFITRANANFVTPWMAFGPRGDFDHRAQPNLPRPHPGEVQYSSDKDIDTLVDKMDQLYAMGLRNFGINYDDLQNYREQTLIGGDKDRFGSDSAAFAKAHAYFFSQVISRLKARHPSAKLQFMTVPYPYWFPSRGRGNAYFKAFADGLPRDVEMITCSYTDADLLAMHEMTGRPTLVWHNLFVEDAKTSSHRLTNTTYGPPFFALFTWSDPNVRAAMSGLINLMPQPDETPEDPAHTSWLTAGDWQWAPDRYNPLLSFQSAASLHNH